MTRDICDGEITLASPAAITDWNAMVLAFLAHDMNTPKLLVSVLEQAPGCAMAHAARGIFSMLAGRRELVETAAVARKAAHAALAGGPVSARERGWIATLDGWLDSGPTAAIRAIEAVIAANPCDTFSIKISHQIRFVIGDAPGMRRSLERVIAAHATDHPCRGYLEGCYAFALEETGDYAAATRAGRAGLEKACDDAWGLHAVTHVFDMTGQAAAGIRLIEAHDGAWLHCNNFRYHVWWHKALLHLDQGDTAEVLALYDQKIRIDKTDDYRDIANATSLLMRLELEGVNVGNRWGELADLSEKRSDDNCLVFADLHYMLALTGDQREGAAERLVARLQRDAGQGSEMGRIVADPGVAAAAGLAAFGEARYDVAFARLMQARPKMQTIGGSHAQRDVFERITVDAGIRSGHLDQAEGVLRERTLRRAGVEDAFAANRFSIIERARREAMRIPAQ